MVKVKGNSTGGGQVEIVKGTSSNGIVSSSLFLINHPLVVNSSKNEILDLIAYVDSVESFDQKAPNAKVEKTIYQFNLDGLKFTKDKKGNWEMVNEENEIVVSFKIKNISKFREFLLGNNDFIKIL